MRSFVSWVIGRLKGDTNYRLDARFSLADLAIVLWSRGRQALRGAWLGIFCRQAGIPLFVGRRVVVEGARHVRCGKSCILDDGARVLALSETGITLGNNVTIGRDAILQCTGVIARLGVGIRIGDNSAVGAQSFLGGQGGIGIGSNVIMGPGVRIFSENHRFDDLSVPIRLQGESRRGVVIQDDCWIGAGAIIVDGVNIGTGCVVAAGAVVTKDVPNHSVVGGVPAKVLAVRGNARMTDVQ